MISVSFEWDLPRWIVIGFVSIVALAAMVGIVGSILIRSSASNQQYQLETSPVTISPIKPRVDGIIEHIEADPETATEQFALNAQTNPETSGQDLLDIATKDKGAFATLLEQSAKEYTEIMGEVLLEAGRVDSDTIGKSIVQIEDPVSAGELFSVAARNDSLASGNIMSVAAKEDPYSTTRLLVESSRKDASATIGALSNGPGQDADAMKALGEFLPVAVWAPQQLPTLGLPGSGNSGWTGVLVNPAESVAGSTSKVENVVENIVSKFGTTMTDVRVGAKETNPTTPDNRPGRIVNRYLSLTPENFNNKDLLAAYVIFALEKQWLADNQLHEWSVEFSRFDDQSQRWHSTLSKRVGEEHDKILFSVPVAGFSVWSISASLEPPEPIVRVERFVMSADEIVEGNSIELQIDVTNLAEQVVHHTLSIWLDKQLYRSMTVELPPTTTKTVEVILSPSWGNHEIRIDRHVAGLVVTEVQVPAATSILTIAPTPIPLQVPPTATPTPTHVSPMATATFPPTATPSATNTPTATPSATNTPPPTPSPRTILTASPTFTATPMPCLTPTLEPLDSPTSKVSASPAPTPSPTSKSTATATFFPTHTPSATPTPTIAVLPSNTPMPRPSPTPSPIIAAILTPTVTPTQKSSPTAAVVVPPPTNTAQPAQKRVEGHTGDAQPTRTAKTTHPLPGDDRYAGALHSRTALHNLDVLLRIGVRWYLDLESDMSQVPEGARKVPYLKLPTSAEVWNATGMVRPDRIDILTDAQRASMGFLTSSELHSLAQTNSGSYWYIFGEPNRYAHMTGTRFAPVFHYYASALTDADPTAKVLSPSVLNWDFVCIGCGGYQLGEVWAKEFVDAYETKYERKPPVDVWTIDTYPIDWLNTPNNDPNQLPLYIPGAGPIQLAGNGSSKHSSIATQQLIAMRQYLKSIGHDSKPIWITEVAIHVGYDPQDWSLKNTGAPCNIVQVITSKCVTPSQDLCHWDKMSHYVIELLDWLDANAEEHGVEKWFFYKTYRDLINIANDGYMGISFLDDPSMGTTLNCLGETYRTRSLGLVPLMCDATCNTIKAD